MFTNGFNGAIGMSGFDGMLPGGSAAQGPGPMRLGAQGDVGAPGVLGATRQVQEEGSFLPFVVDHTAAGERAFDIFSRLLDNRVVFLGDVITDHMANCVVAQLLHLQATGSDKDIQLYINSPGGSVSAGLAILDTMDYVSCDVSTICIGRAASMAAVLLAGGAKGKRVALPNSRIMIHQPSGGAQGQQTDIAIAAEEILKTRERLNTILADRIGQDVAVVKADTERDNYMTAHEALAYGILDIVLDGKSSSAKN